MSAKFDSLSMASISQSTVSAIFCRPSWSSSDWGSSFITLRTARVSSSSNCFLFKNPGGVGSIMISPSTIFPLYHHEAVLPPLCRKRFLRGILLRFLLASPLARSQAFGTDKSAYEEGFVMVGAALAHDLIGGRDALLFLCYFLQLALGILPEPALNDRIGFVEKLVGDEFLRDVVARIKVERSDKRFKSICENYHPRTTRILRLAAREQEVLDDTELRPRVGDTLRIDECCAEGGQFPFRLFGILGVQKFGDRELGDDIDEKCGGRVVPATRGSVLIEI